MTGAWEEGRRLLDSGQVDAAIAQLQGAGAAPETQYFLGRAWARKAETAPLPTPPPVPPGHKGPRPPAPEFKPEEIEAVAAYERAISARPAYGEAHAALADLLSPHALRRHEREKAETARARVGRGASPSPDPVDFGPDRVIREYEAASGETSLARYALETLAAFASRTGRHDAVRRAYQGLLQREPQDTATMMRFAEFLLAEAKAPLEAIDVYGQVLLLKPGDAATEARVGQIYLDLAAQALSQDQYAVAQAHLQQAARHVTDRGSPLGRRLEEYQKRLQAFRR